MTARSSRQKFGHPKNDEYYTPLWIFEALKLEFDLDPCSPITGSFVPTQHRYHLPGDGLTASWFGLIWMNPPFSKPSPWVEKFIDHKNGIALLPMSMGKWFESIWEAADGIVILPRTIKFERPNNERGDIFSRTLLFAFGEISYQALKSSNLGKVR